MLSIFIRLYAQAGFKSCMSYSEIDSRIQRNVFYTVVYDFSTWFSTSVSSMRIARLLNARFITLNWCTANCIAEGKAEAQLSQRSCDLSISDCSVHAKNRRKPVSSRPIIAKHYIFVPVLINVSGFSARCVTRCQDELTRTKKLESCAAERNVLYELPETWANSSLTDISSICNAIKRPMQ